MQNMIRCFDQKNCTGNESQAEFITGIFLPINNFFVKNIHSYLYTHALVPDHRQTWAVHSLGHLRERAQI